MSQKSELVPKRRFKEFENAGDWELCKLGEIGNTFTGLSGKTKEDFGHGEAEFVTYVNVYKNAIADPLLTEHVELDEKQNEVNYGDIFFTTSSETPEEVGLSSVWLDNARNIYLNSFCFGFRPKINVEPYFMAYMLRSEPARKKITFLAQGISRYNISKTKMMDIQVSLPVLEEQSKLGKFFKTLDDTITLHQRKLDTLNNIKQSYLYQMFPQNGEKVPKMRFAGFSGDWKQRELSGMIEKVIDNRGKTPPLDLEGGYPMIEVAALGNLYPDYSKVIKYVNEETFKSWFRGYLQEGDLLFSTVGNTGLTSLMDDNNKAVIAQNIIGMRFTEKYSPNFMNQLFKLRDSMEKVKQIEMGAVQPSVKVSQLIHLKYYVPSLEEQQKIGQFFKQLDETIDIQEQELEKLKNLKEAYLNEMFV